MTLMEDPKSKKGRESPGAGGPQGVGVPAKGDSSAPFDPMDGATISDVPSTPPAKPTTPPTRAVNPDPTISDSIPATPPSSGTGRYLSGIYMKEAVLQPGDLIGARYEILQLLGEGGMGAVYKALDREVERTVALKLIRPELASNPAILARFKQELLTAHQVTHKNVIRIYDIAEADGVKFITMEFVEGHDLRRILIDNGKLPRDQVVEIIRQVCLALDAAHSAGVIHRDLKPQNIMQEVKTGRILVMDFGLARTIGGDGMTQTGALLGTIEYMSPEQSMGKALDQRSDIFTVGLIFYELLVGKTPYKADTAMASLLRRNQERAVPAAELDSSVPKALSDIVSKCLERDLEHRYQNVQEILHDLDAFQGARPTLASISLPAVAPAAPTKSAVPWKWIGIGTLALAVIGGGWVLKSYVFRSSTPSGAAAVKGPELSLAILPFQNASGDPAIDWLGTNLSDMLSTDVGQSAHLRTISSDRLHQVLSDLRITPGTSIDPTMVSRIAEFTNANTVVWGQYARFGQQIRIDATLLDLKHNRRASLKIEAASEKEIPGTVDGLAELIRKNLAVSPDVLKELKASSFQPSSKSVPALRDYNQSLQLLREGKNLEAVKMLQNAVQEDPQFALAYSRLAEADSALGIDGEAEQNSRKALELSQQLPPAEKYLIEATHASVMKDNKKAIEAYENLAKIFPENADVEYTLGALYMQTGDFDKARSEFSKILNSDPKNIKALWQMGVVEFMNSNPQAALEPLNKGLSLAIEVDNQEQKALLLQALGISYRLMNKPEEAMRNYQESMDINRRLGLKRNLANNLSEMAQVQSTLGKLDAALADYNQALQILNDIGMRKELGDILIDRGNLYDDQGYHDKALQDYKQSLQIQTDNGDEHYQALCLNNIGDVYLAKYDTDNALTYLQQALQLREKLKVQSDIAETLSGLGAVFTTTGRYDEALASLMRALDLYRKGGDGRGAADVSHQIGLVFQHQGRFGAAVSAMQDAVRGYRTVGDRSSAIVESLTELADVLAQSGSGEQSVKLLEEAQALARDLKNNSLHAGILNVQGDVQFYRGDVKGAGGFYDQAVRAASQGTDREQQLVSKLNVAKVALASGRAHSTLRDLGALTQQADNLNMKYLGLKSSVEMAQAMVDSKDYTHALQELRADLDKSEKLGTRYQTARIHFLLGNAMRLSGNAGEGSGHYRQAITLLDEMKREPGAQHLLERTDLKTMYADATRWSSGG
jgi:eukaryotic-like serine/threonine-protein kinase